MAQMSWLLLYFIASIVYGLDSNSSNITNNTPSPTIDGCTPYIETLHFYNEQMDGIWVYDKVNEWYRLNISDSDAYYVMMDIGYGIWAVDLITANNETDIVIYCTVGDLSQCAGHWQIGDVVYDPDATSQLVDCTYTECDVIGLNVHETQC